MYDINNIPFPPENLMQLVCGNRIGPELKSTFVNSGHLQMKRFYDLGLINENTNLIDVGCGCGRFARALINTPIKSYSGFDRHQGLISWAQHNLTPIDSRFEFIYVDVTSPYETIDNMVGNIPAKYFTFPYRDGEFNAANLASVFTHMYIEEVDRYLQELARVVAKGGTMIFSVFLTKRKPYSNLHNVFFSPDDFRKLVESNGWLFVDEDYIRFKKDAFKFDNNQQNFFTATRQ